MDIIKKLGGITIMLLGLIALIKVLEQAYLELSSNPDMEKQVFWPVILPVFLPVIAGFILFGYFAMKGEY
jgi:hypothetical protein